MCASSFISAKMLEEPVMGRQDHSWRVAPMGGRSQSNTYRALVVGVADAESPVADAVEGIHRPRQIRIPTVVPLLVIAACVAVLISRFSLPSQSTSHSDAASDYGKISRFSLSSQSTSHSDAASDYGRTASFWSMISDIFGGQEEETSTSTSMTTTSSMTVTSTVSTTMTSTSAVMTTTTPTGRSLYCFAVARPKFGEIMLMDTQLNQRVGIFQCDSYSVFSNVRTAIANNETVVETEVIDSSLEAPIGGTFNMSLNTKIFLKVWHRIFEVEEYARHDWTVKVDPDAVFLPDRLRRRVAREEAQITSTLQRGVYLNNCKIGNHGPIEVISTHGMEVFRGGIDRCVEKNYAPVNKIGEDVFTRRCWTHLGVTPLDDFQLLSEINCFENPTPCFSGKAVFHPFKTKESFLQCLKEAREGKAPPGLPHACENLGCSHHYMGEHTCQCNGECSSFGNCCDDYKAVCIPHLRSGRSALVR